MSALDELISQIQNDNLRERIKKEVEALKRTKTFGLVFEQHKPECTPLYNVPVKKNSLVALKAGNINDTYRVYDIKDHKVFCYRNDETFTFDLNDVVAVAQFGDPIFPYLQPIDAVANAPDSDLWHALIEAENYHALQLLNYLYADKVDCIYIDPPYNTGARDWKYNNNYVDSGDKFSSSKWLSMMQRRLELAKKLLNPADSVLIVTIDEHEYLHLGCLLEEMFRDANIQMVSTAINPKGIARGEFFRVNEYLFFVRLGASSPTELALPDEWRGNIKESTIKKLRWGSLMRSGTGSSRKDSPGCFYPIFISADKKFFCGAGNALPVNVDRNSIDIPSGQLAIFPIHDDGSEGRWQYSRDKFLEIQRKGYVRISTQTKTNKEATIRYISEGWQKKVESGAIKTIGKAEDGSLIFDDEDYIQKFLPANQWWIPSHNATEFGSKLLAKILGNRFAFPKSLYAVRDCLKFFVANKPNALIVDFFAGSGTTLHAVNLLNEEDGGNRRCILVTNNEVSDAEEKNLRRAGYTPESDEWQKLGIARYVTWPRTVCSIEGHDINGEPLKGKYLDTEKEMSEGFKANAAYFKLGFLDKDSVAMGRQFKELLPVLWFKAGCHGKCPELEGNEVPAMLVLRENKFAVLTEEKYFSEFASKLKDAAEIDTIFIITNSASGYRSMISEFRDKTTYQLYRDYLENFKIDW